MERRREEWRGKEGIGGGEMANKGYKKYTRFYILDALTLNFASVTL